MLEVVFLVVLALIWIIFATIQDIRTREVANWLSFSLIIFALGFRFFWCLFSPSANGFLFFYWGLLGFGIFFVLGNLLYYCRLFAGGDAKLLIALGAVLPFSENFFINLKIFAMFLLLFLFAGAVYGLIFSFVLVGRNFKNFKKEFAKRFSNSKKFVFGFLIGAILFAILGFFESLFFFLAILIFVIPYFYLYAKSIEECCMVKLVNVRDLREGDWLYENVKLGRKTIRACWDGLSEKEIKLLRKSKRKIKIKQGIPFVPVFLISFVILIFLWFGNLLGGFWIF